MKLLELFANHKTTNPSQEKYIRNSLTLLDSLMLEDSRAAFSSVILNHKVEYPSEFVLALLDDKNGFPLNLKMSFIQEAKINDIDRLVSHCLTSHPLAASLFRRIDFGLIDSDELRKKIVFECDDEVRCSWLRHERNNNYLSTEEIKELLKAKLPQIHLYLTVAIKDWEDESKKEIQAGFLKLQDLETVLQFARNVNQIVLDEGEIIKSLSMYMGTTEIDSVVAWDTMVNIRSTLLSKSNVGEKVIDWLIENESTPLVWKTLFEKHGDKISERQHEQISAMTNNKILDYYVMLEHSKKPSDFIIEMFHINNIVALTECIKKCWVSNKMIQSLIIDEKSYTRGDLNTTTKFDNFFKALFSHPSFDSDLLTSYCLEKLIEKDPFDFAKLLKNPSFDLSVEEFLELDKYVGLKATDYTKKEWGFWKSKKESKILNEQAASLVDVGARRGRVL